MQLFILLFQIVALLSPINAERNTDDIDVDHDGEAQEKTSTSLKLTDERGKNRTDKVREVVASVSEHACTQTIGGIFFTQRLSSILFFLHFRSVEK